MRWLRRRLPTPDCSECGHVWEEHPGGGLDDDPVQAECGECQYELEHGFLSQGAALCRLRAYHSRVQVLLADVHTALRDREPTSAGETGPRVGPVAVAWVSPAPHWRTARVQVSLPGGADVELMEDNDTVQVFVDHYEERLLSDDQEARLVADPTRFLQGLVAASPRRGTGTNRSVVAQLMAEHESAPFPARLRGEEIARVDAVMLDADVTGCVITWLGNRERLAREHERLLPRLLAQVEAVLSVLTDVEEIEYYRRLRTMARAISS